MDDEQKQQFPPLEIKCEKCEGVGYLKDYSQCYECNETGYIVTEFGEHVIEFLQRHVTFGGRIS